MSGFDLHPEELLDRVRRGQASAVERARVEQHLAHCEACRFEHALLAQSARDAAPHPGDGERARRIEQAAAATLAARGVLAQGTQSKRARRASALVAAAVVSSLATAAAAAVITQPAWLARVLPLPSAPAAASPSAAAPHPIRRAHTRTAPAPSPAPPPAQPLAIDPDPPAPALPPAPAPPQRTATAPGAAELFAAANLARREHETGNAVRLYRELARRHPRSAEAAVSRVALGRLLLDRLGDARGALREFDGYLQDRREQALREDALIGRALALGRLGRAGEERAAWQSLLSGFPGSGYAESARARLEELR
jgi:TolA-binding protein